MADELRPDGYAYRYGDNCIRFNDGGSVNGGDPIATIPFWYQSGVDALVEAALRRASEIAEVKCWDGGSIPGVVSKAILALTPEPAGRHLEAVIAAETKSLRYQVNEFTAKFNNECLLRKMDKDNLELREAQAALTEAEWWMNNWYGEHSKYKECECLACNRLAAARERVTKLTK